MLPAPIRRLCPWSLESARARQSTCRLASEWITRARPAAPGVPATRRPVASVQRGRHVLFLRFLLTYKQRINFPSQDSPGKDRVRQPVDSDVCALVISAGCSLPSRTNTQQIHPSIFSCWPRFAIVTVRYVQTSFMENERMGVPYACVVIMVIMDHIFSFKDLTFYAFKWK